MCDAVLPWGTADVRDELAGAREDYFRTQARCPPQSQLVQGTLPFYLSVLFLLVYFCILWYHFFGYPLFEYSSSATIVEAWPSSF